MKNKIGDNEVICGLSGGVDSSVLATLLHKAIGNKSKAIFIDHGLLRKMKLKMYYLIYKRSWYKYKIIR